MFDKLLKLVNNLNLELLKIQSTKDNKILWIILLII